MHEEHALQAFKKRDHDRDGFISTRDFYVIIRMLKSHLLTPFVEENLVTVSVSEVHVLTLNITSCPYFSCEQPSVVG